MKMRKLFLAALAMVVLSTLSVPTNAQMNEQSAREKALSVARPKLSYLRPGQFLASKETRDWSRNYQPWWEDWPVRVHLQVESGRR